MDVAWVTHVVNCRGELDATSLAPPTGVDLGLDHDRGAETFGGGHRLVHREGDLTLGDGHAVAGEELLSLILEQIHPVASRRFQSACIRRRRPVDPRLGSGWASRWGDVTSIPAH